MRHLARLVGLAVLHKRASDLLGTYVGKNKQQIAAAFAEARDTGMFLVLDEADSLLADRRGAHHAWEVSQVNEMLTWMESHPMPFACTTNLAGTLDPASLRRFTVKACFGTLRPDQAAAAVQRFVGLPAPSGLARLGQLAPADFALVRKRTGLLDETPGPEALLAELAAESAGREGSRRIGFAAWGGGLGRRKPRPMRGRTPPAGYERDSRAWWPQCRTGRHRP